MPTDQHWEIKNETMVETHSTYLFDEMMKGASEVDYTNVWDAMGFATLIFAVGNEIGLIFATGNRQSYEAIQTTKLAKEWIYNVKSLIGRMSAGDAMDVLESYDFMHRLAQRSPIPREFADEYLFKALDARIHGDKSVNEYHLFRYIRTELNKKNKPFFDKPLQWYSSSLNRWFKKFKYGSTFENISDYDTLEIISILLSEDLFVFADGDQNLYKKKLFDNYKHLLDKIGDYGFNELNALSHFLNWSRKFMTGEEYTAYDNAITLAQIASPETNRFYRFTLKRNLALLTE